MVSKTVTKSINTVIKVKEFVEINSKFAGDVSIISGRYVVDGKSLMGIFSLDLSHPVDVKIEGDFVEDVEGVIEAYDLAGI